MASDASVADRTIDGTEEKEVVHEEKNFHEENASQPKQIDESGGVEKPKLEESVSSTPVATGSKQPTQGREEEAPVAEGPAPGAVEDHKDGAPPVEEVNKESEDAKASGPEVTVNNKDETSAAEVVKESAEIEETSRPDEPEIEAPKKEPEAAPPVQETEQTGLEPQVPEPVAKTTGEPLDITNPSEEQPVVLAVAEPATDASVEPEKKDVAPEAGEIVGASKQQQFSTTETEAGSELSNKAVDVKEVGISTLQALATVLGSPTELNDAKAPEVLVKPELDVEEHKEEKSVVTETVVEECKEEVKTVETEPVEGRKEEIAAAIEATLTDDTKGTGEQSGDPAAEVTEAPSEKEKPPEGVEKVVHVQKDFGGGSDSSTEKIAEEPEDESVKDVTSVVQASRDIDLEGKASEAADEPINGPEKAQVASSEKDETVEKKDETEKTGPQDLAESSEGGGAGSKTDVEVQKSETPAKPKTLMSKVKHSIGKVKKAIIGKSPSSKTMSAEPKEDQLNA